MEAADLLVEIKKELNDVKKTILQMSNAPSVSDKWIPRAKVMEFLDYRATQMAAFFKSVLCIFGSSGLQTSGRLPCPGKFGTRRHSDKTLCSQPHAH
jgi:hypothetical protein